MKKFIIPAMIAIMAIAAAAEAHYHVIVPHDYSQWKARKSEKVPMNLIWGHGYEHIWFDIEKPLSFEVIKPGGERSDLMKSISGTMIKSVTGEKKKAYKFEYKPTERGDHIFVLDAGWQWDEEDSAWLKDYARAVLHVQAESDWGREVGLPLEVVPLSRPYGVVKGDALSFQVLHDGDPVSGIRVEREIYNQLTPSPDSLPGEEFIAYSAVTGPDGTVAFSFPTSGWHGITAIMETEKTRDAGGHQGKIIERSTMWVYVSP